MTWFTENPLPPVLIGIVVEAMLVVALFRTGKRGFLWAMLGMAAAVIGIVILERMFITPREEVKAALEEIRLLVETNDRQGLLKRIDSNPDAARLRNQVQNDLTQITVTEATITDLRDEDIKFNESSTFADVSFIGAISLKPGRVPRDRLVFRFEVDMIKKDGIWIVSAADYRLPFGQ